MLDEVLAGTDPLAIRALAAVAAVDGCTDGQLEAVLASVGIDSATPWTASAGTWRGCRSPEVRWVLAPPALGRGDPVRTDRGRA